MSRYVVLAQSKETAGALEAALQILCGEAASRDGKPSTIVWGGSIDRETAIDSYEVLTRRIEEIALAGEDVDAVKELVVLVDAIDPAALSAVSEGGWDSLIAMLILTFPELRWVFGLCMGTGQPNVDNKPEQKWDNVHAGHSLVSLLLRARRDPLFDPTGLRDWIRERTNRALADMKDDLRLPLRPTLAAAIDEERPYAYLHGCTAYRFGCRVDLVTTWTSMQERFGKSAAGKCGESKQEPHGYWLLLEDMSLNFPDRERGVHLLDLEDRATHCPRLNSRSAQEQSEYRVLVTTGQSRPQDDVLSRNRAYLRGKVHRFGMVVLKPSSGMFELWRKAGLLRRKPSNGRAGNVPDFYWPPVPPEPRPEIAGHGAPGKLLRVAESLIRRGESLLGRAESVGDAVRGAVLATDALEYTGGRTPTTATEALSLKHQFEVLAECQFSGVEYHLSIKPRLHEIRVETEAISRWFHRRRKTDAMLNGEMNILHGIVGVFRQNFQFDEEQVCMSRIRHLHNTLWMRQRRIRFVLWPLLRYLELLLSSFAVFVAVMALWILGLGALFEWANNYSPAGPGFADAISSFFSVGPPITHRSTKQNLDITWEHVAVACTAIVSGFIHLGVFVSHLYSITSRR